MAGEKVHTFCGEGESWEKKSSRWVGPKSEAKVKIWRLLEAGATPPRGKNNNEDGDDDGRRRRINL